MCTLTHTYSRAHTQLYECTHTHICMHTRVYMHTIYTYTYAHTYTYQNSIGSCNLPKSTKILGRFFVIFLIRAFSSFGHVYNLFSMRFRISFAVHTNFVRTCTKFCSMFSFLSIWLANI